jgi:hypothetical protein
MSFEGWGYQFEGAYTNPGEVPGQAGVYTVWCWENNKWKLLDVGQSENMRQRLINHDRVDCWEQNCGGSIYFFVVAISSEEERRALEQTIRQQGKPPCGEV